VEKPMENNKIPK